LIRYSSFVLLLVLDSSTAIPFEDEDDDDQNDISSSVQGKDYF